MNTSLLRASTVYIAFAVIIFVGSAGYGTLNFRVYAAQKQAIEDNRGRFDKLTAAAEVSEKQYRNFSEERSKKQHELRKKVTAILPSDENYTDLTRLLDAYFAENDRSGNPIFQSSLRYGKGSPTGEIPNIYALPFTMNIEATRDNFFKFLNFVNSSGSLSNGQRLLEIHSIQLNFPEGGEVIQDLKQKLNFTVEMSAYYHDVKVPR